MARQRLAVERDPQNLLTHAGPRLFVRLGSSYRENGFHVEGIDANDFRDRWGLIHARQAHPSLYDPENLRLSHTGIEYLTPIFSNAIGQDDMEDVRRTMFSSGSLAQPYHSVNVDLNKRICFLD